RSIATERYTYMPYGTIAWMHPHNHNVLLKSTSIKTGTQDLRVRKTVPQLLSFRQKLTFRLPL
ncbi:MAG: hypothetical protein ACTJHT_05450, partial [Sphingobacterium sp.]